MKIVIDVNRIIAAMIKQSTTRDLLFDEFFEFITPDHTLAEIEKHKDELMKKAKLSNEGFETLLTLIFERITILPKSEYSGLIEKCKQDISDIDDVPYLALCLAVKAESIWSHDPHFLEQKKVKILTNIDMLRISKKSDSIEY